MSPRWHLSGGVAIGTLRANPLHPDASAVATKEARADDAQRGILLFELVMGALRASRSWSAESV